MGNGLTNETGLQQDRDRTAMDTARGCLVATVSPGEGKRLGCMKKREREGEKNREFSLTLCCY